MARVRIILIVTGLLGKKFHESQTQISGWSPLLPTYFLILTSEFSLILNTHLQPIADLCWDRGTRDQVWFLSSASNSSFIAASHLGSCKSCLTDLGSACARSKVGLILGWTISYFALVTIGWTLAGLTGPGLGESRILKTFRWSSVSQRRRRILILKLRDSWSGEETDSITGEWTDLLGTEGWIDSVEEAELVFGGSGLVKNR